MKLFTSKHLEEGSILESNKWYLNIEYKGSPYEAFTDIPFISNSDSKVISEEGTAIAVFDTEREAELAFSKVKNNEFQINKPDIVLTHNGIVLDSY